MRAIELNWEGPFKLGESLAPQIPKTDFSGVYLSTIPVDGEELIHYVGEAGGVVSRWSDHLVYTLGGRYVIYDADVLRRGVMEAPIYGDKGYTTNLIQLTAEKVRKAYEYASSCNVFWARFERRCSDASVC